MECVRQALHGPPLRLLAICAAQAVVQIVDFVVSTGAEECKTTTVGDEVVIDCEQCGKEYTVAGVLLAVGLLIVSLGVAAALRRSMKLCRWYGMIMLVYAFVLVLMSLLFALDSIVLQNILDGGLDGNSKCEESVKSMLVTSRITSIIYAINAVLCVGGAIWAIKSREQFSYELIAEGHEQARRDYTDRL